MKNANDFVNRLEQFIEAKVRDMESGAIEDAVSLNKAREDLTLLLQEANDDNEDSNDN